ncbi:MAG TPA: glycoside hydrolase family 2 TIM barrel-domain containing protein [Acidimicrobiales bacterium]|nr:glycoside hydrolase family 2 TIM barrel-domain containing protein [Acidimicrobiales bacterium]
MSSFPVLQLDEHGRASLDGAWDFFPGDHSRQELKALTPDRIHVPGLWETQGWLELDGVAWYRRRFSLDDVSGFWSLRFGAVMDVSEVWLNDQLLGGHDNPFTPFVVDPSPVLRAGDNELLVRVFDPSVTDPEHIRLAHGKQGWANHVFPSRPSLYMTYGGIWQPVLLRRHGPVVVDDVFVNSDPDDLTIEVTLKNVSDEPHAGSLGISAVGRFRDELVELPAGASVVRTVHLGSSEAARWSPQSPNLHTLLADVKVDGSPSDDRSTRFGLRTLRIEGNRLLINDQPYRMKSALVQGFRAEELYAEGDRAAIEQEVRAALDMGFNTLRLHIKAFDPTYLDVCDELGMLLHCDIPVAEPIEHEALGAEGESVISTRSVEAVRQQICRDRNHPSVILWSVMNELCFDRIEARGWDGYERFARALVGAAKQVDPTRPVIENDWVEPDPERVFAADVLTAHWYGRLHAEYLDKIEAASQKWENVDRPLYVTEFGDWGLPAMPTLPDPPFWDTRSIYAAGLADTRWPASMARFVSETQRYQGLSDRLQAEVFRRHDHLGGYCLTELTDVPHELNGLLDLHRQPKPIAVAEFTRANQPVLPMLHLESLVVVAGELIVAPLHVANDGGALEDVHIEARFGDTGAPIGLDDLLRLDTSDMDADAAAARFDESVAAVRVKSLEAHRAQQVGSISLTAPVVPGSHDLVLRLRAAGDFCVENRYTLHVVAPPSTELAVRVLGDNGALSDALHALGATVGEAGPTFVAERGLDHRTGEVVSAHLARGQTVVVLAQDVAATEHFPVPVALFAVQTEWGSSVFHFTTNHGALPSLPRRNVLVAEESTVQAQSVLTSVEGQPFPETPVVIAYKPVPGSMTGTVVGSHPVGPGRVVFCQYRLVGAAVRGDAAARALLADLANWSGRPRSSLVVEESKLDDGRRVARYRHEAVVAR